jgi:hypothetical protein
VTGKPNVAATLEEFTLTEDCKQFIVEHTCGKEQTDPSQQPASQSAHSRKVQLLQQEKQSPPPAVITDDHTQRSLIWVTINHIHLHKSDKDTLLQDEWLNDQHMSVAQSLIKQQHPHIIGLMPTVVQGRNPLPSGSLQILDFAYQQQSLGGCIYM